MEKIVEIIVYVISELKQNKNLAEIDVVELQRQGYTNSQISTAFSWLVDRIEISQQIFGSAFTASNRSFRLLHDAEKDLFTTEAWGSLVLYHSLGLITNLQLESIIERAIMSGSKIVDEEKLKNIIANTIFSAEEDSSMTTRIMLQGNETIN